MRKIREFRGYTEEYMAGELKMHRHTYGKIENGEKDPGIGLLEECARILKVSLHQILNLTEKHVFNSFNQNHSHNHQEADAQYHNMVCHNMDAKERDLYERWIADLKAEIERLRTKHES